MSAKRILVVDDDRDFVEVAKIVLEDAGYEVTAAYDSREALRRAKSMKRGPDVILLDVMMESLCSGFEVARELRDDEKTRSIPIIMVTSVNQKVPYRFCPDEDWLPIDRFLDKPVPAAELVEAVRGVCGAETRKGESS